MTNINKILNNIEGKVDLWEVKNEWNELKRFADWHDFKKFLLGRAIEIRESRIDMDYMYGLCLAAYIMSWDELLERYQEKDILNDWDELCKSLSDEEKMRWPTSHYIVA